VDQQDSEAGDCSVHIQEPQAKYFFFLHLNYLQMLLDKDIFREIHFTSNVTACFAFSSKRGVVTNDSFCPIAVDS